MAIRFKSSFTAKKHIDSIKQRNKTNMGQALSVAKAEMLIDISEGKGFDGAQMKAYSDQKYFDSKGNRIGFFSRKGSKKKIVFQYNGNSKGNPRKRFIGETYKEYKIRKLGTEKVNLTETGKMLKAMQVSVLETSQKLIGRIYFLAGERDKARWNAQIRNFFGLSNSNLTKLKKTLGIK